MKVRPRKESAKVREKTNPLHLKPAVSLWSDVHCSEMHLNIFPDVRRIMEPVTIRVADLVTTSTRLKGDEDCCCATSPMAAQSPVLLVALLMFPSFSPSFSQL